MQLKDARQNSLSARRKQKTVRYFRFGLGFEYRDIRQGLRDTGKRFLELGEKLGEKLEC